MNIYVIDTCRIETWRLACQCPEPLFVYELPDMPGIEPDDVVFAHTHENPIGNETDFCLDGFATPYPHSTQIERFCTSLVTASETERAPFVFLYSGNDLNRARRAAWVMRATNPGGPLDGFSRERILALEDGIARGTPHQRLRKIVAAALAVAHPAAPISSKISGGSISPVSRLDEAEDARLALRLLCEAKKLCGHQTEQRVGDIAIHRPSAEEVATLMGSTEEAAKALFKEADKENEINPAIEEFLKVSASKATTN